MKYALWLVQGLLALAFLLAGLMKLTQPMDVLETSMGWPAALPAPLVRFIGLAELLGAIGLILPALTRIRPGGGARRGRADADHAAGDPLPRLARGGRDDPGQPGSGGPGR